MTEWSFHTWGLETQRFWFPSAFLTSFSSQVRFGSVREVRQSADSRLAACWCFVTRNTGTLLLQGTGASKGLQFPLCKQGGNRMESVQRRAWEWSEDWQSCHVRKGWGSWDCSALRRLRADFSHPLCRAPWCYTHHTGKYFPMGIIQSTTM